MDLCCSPIVMPSVFPLIRGILKGHKQSADIGGGGMLLLPTQLLSMNLALVHLGVNVKVKVAQSCPTLCDPIDYTVHAILQARILEWVAFPFSRGSSQPSNRTQISHIAGDSLPAESQGKPKKNGVGSPSFSSGSSRPRNGTWVSCIAGGFFTNWAMREAPKNYHLLATT